MWGSTIYIHSKRMIVCFLFHSSSLAYLPAIWLEGGEWLLSLPFSTSSSTEPLYYHWRRKNNFLASLMFHWILSLRWRPVQPTTDLWQFFPLALLHSRIYFLLILNKHFFFYFVTDDIQQSLFDAWRHAKVNLWTFLRRFLFDLSFCFRAKFILQSSLE